MSTSKESNFVSVVVYVHGDRRGLGDFLGDLVRIMQAAFSSWELICVNDACPEETRSELTRFTEAHAGVGISVVNLSSFHGVERAMRAGVDLAIGDFVCEIDNWGDGFSPQDILEAYKKALEGYDVVSCFVPGVEGRGSHLFYRLFNATAGLPHEIHADSFRIVSRRLVNRVKNAYASIPYRKVAYASSGLPLTAIELVAADDVKTANARKHDRDDRRFRRDLAIDALILFTRTGYRIALGAAFLMMAIALAGFVYSIASYVNGLTVSGWTTTILFMAVSFFGLFGLAAIVIKYLQVLVDLSFRNTQYEYSDIERP